MCNLYSMTTNQEAVRRLFAVHHDRTGNMPSLPGIFPDYLAPIVRNGADSREPVMARWGMPGPLVAGGYGGFEELKIPFTSGAHHRMMFRGQLCGGKICYGFSQLFRLQRLDSSGRLLRKSIRPDPSALSLAILPVAVLTLVTTAS